MLSRHAQQVYGAKQRRRRRRTVARTSATDGHIDIAHIDNGDLALALVGAGSPDQKVEAATKRNRKYEEALRRRDFRVVLWMIANGDVPADYETVGGETALLAAISAKDVQAVERIVAGGVSISQANKHRYTPLMKAIATSILTPEASKGGQVLPRVTTSPKQKLVKRISNKYRVSTRSSRDNDDLCSDLSSYDDPSTAVFDNSMVEFVLQLHPDLSACDDSGKSAFDWARLTHNHAALRMLEAKEKSEALHNSSSSNRQQRIAECWDILTQNSAYVTTSQSFLGQPSFSNQAFIDFLRSTCVNATAFAEALGDLRRAEPEAVDKTAHHLQFFVNVEMRDGWTPLVKCAALGHLAAVQELIAMGANPHHETRLRHTAMTWASYCGHEAVVLHLLRIGVYATQVTREGRTALIHAACNSQPKIVHHVLIALRNQAFPAVPNETFDDNSASSLSNVPEEQQRRKQPGAATEWHEAFLRFVMHRDQYDKTAIDYAEEKISSLGSARDSTGSAERGDELECSTPADQVLKQLRAAVDGAKAHRDYVLIHRERTQPTRCKHKGCAFVAPKDVLPTHEAHYCVKRTVKCERCEELFAFESKQQHEELSCLQRLVPCPNLQFGCRERIVFINRAHHAETHCRKRLVECRRGCGATVCFDQLDGHESLKCSLRTVSCDYGCPVTFLAREAKTHYRKHCSKRMVECIGSFSSSNRMEEMSTGSSGQAIAGCGMLVKVEDMEFHVSTLCALRKRRCKWAVHGCDQHIGGTPEARIHHEDNECKFRLMTCRNEGCVLSGKIPACFANEHYAWQCMLEKKPCTNACVVGSADDGSSDPNNVATTLPEHLHAAHCYSDAGDCSKRLSRCPLDLCGKRIRIYDSACEIITDAMTSDVDMGHQQCRVVSVKALRKRVKRSTSALKLLQRWHNSTSTNETNCSVDSNTFALMDLSLLHNPDARVFFTHCLGELHKQLESELQTLEADKLAGSICGTVLNFDASRQAHLIQFPDGSVKWRSLTRREYDLLNTDSAGIDASVQSAVPHPSAASDTSAQSFTCGFVRADAVAHHIEHECAHRLVPCPLNCGQRLPFHTVSVHLAKRCGLRNAACRLGCGDVMPFTHLAEHEETNCSLRSVSCGHCRESIPIRSLGDHERVGCQALPRPCLLGCPLQVAWRDATNHETTACTKRLVQCPTCDEYVIAGDLDSHAREECPLRTFGPCTANCGQALKYNQVTHHLLFECQKRVVVCSFCSERVVFDHLAQHKSLMCAQRLVFCRRGCGKKLKDADADAHEHGECSRRLVPCPNHCGLQIPYHLLEAHLQSECSMRALECSLGCRERILAYLMDEHWKRCRQRVIPCGTGAKACERPIRLWVSGRQLACCTLHSENALLFAIKAHDLDLVAYLLQSIDDASANVVNAEFASNGFAPLALAAALGDQDIIKLLLSFGASANLETSRGRTALMEATMAGNPDVVKLLLDHRASVFHTNRMGRSVLALARELATASAASTSSASDGAKATDVHHSTMSNVKAASYARVLELLEAQAELERDQHALFVAIACSDYDWVSNCLKFGQRPSSRGTNASDGGAAATTNIEEVLERELREQQAIAEHVQKKLEVAVHLFDESVADTEAKTLAASNLTALVDNCARQIQRVEQCHEESMIESSSLEVDMLGLIREITAHDVASLLSAHVPSEEALVVMKAICLMCGALPRGRRDATEYSDVEWWKTAQALLMDRSLLRRLRGYRSQRISADVMAKVRRECMRSPAFAACAAAFEAKMANKSAATLDGAGPGEGASRRPSTAVTATVNAVRTDLVNTLAAWVKGVDREYRSQSERQTFVERKRKMALALNATQATLQQATFAMNVATRSLPVRQQEVDAARSELEVVEKGLAVARERIKVHRLLTYPALSGHTPLSFAAAVGNDAMVHMLLARGAVAGYSIEEQSLCASLLQVLVRDHQYRKTRQRQQQEAAVNGRGEASKSDAATGALVRNVTHAFLLGHYRRKLTHFRQTHRVALHEAVFNGFPEIADVLLSHGAALWQRTHILPLRALPCKPMVASEAIPWLSQDAAKRVLRSEGWVLQPLEAVNPPRQGVSQVLRHGDADSEPDGAPMTLAMTVQVAMQYYNCQALPSHSRGAHKLAASPNKLKPPQPSSASDADQGTYYSRTREYVQTALESVSARISQRRSDVLARKSVARRSAEQRALHESLEHAIVARDFAAVAELLDRGAHSDFETRADGVTALMAACVEEVYVTNADGVDVLAVEFLLERKANRPAVDFESSASGRTALLTSARFGTRKCANVLYAHGARANAGTRRDGRTALMEAARCGQHEFVRWLLAIPEVDVFAVDLMGRSALEFARDSRCAVAVAMLSAAMGGNRGRPALYMSVDTSPLHAACKWGCGFIGLVESHEVAHARVVRDTFPLAQHEESECPKRSVACPLGCGAGELDRGSSDAPTDGGGDRRRRLRDLLLLAEDVDEHLASECPLQVVACRNASCRQQDLQRHDREQHERDACAFRVVLCACGERMTRQKHELHAQSTCPQRPVACPLGCQHEGESLRFADLKQHLASKCPMRRVRCRHGCAVSDLVQRSRDVHEARECPLRRVDCRWRCGDVVLARSQLAHEQDECELREAACPSRCGARCVVGEPTDEHVRSECSKRLVLCSLGCGRRVPVDAMAKHQATECRKRRVQCARCQQYTLDEDAAAHDKRECSMRLASCGLCGQTGLVHADLATHRREHCRMRSVVCAHGCLTPGLRAVDKQRHELWECKLRPVWCPLGCGAVLTDNTLRTHERDDCSMRFVTCALGCGAELRAKDAAEHEQAYCSSLSKGRRADDARDGRRRVP